MTTPQAPKVDPVILLRRVTQTLECMNLPEGWDLSEHVAALREIEISMHNQSDELDKLQRAMEVNIDVLKIIEFLKSKPLSEVCVFPIQISHRKALDLNDSSSFPLRPEIFQLKVINPYFEGQEE